MRKKGNKFQFNVVLKEPTYSMKVQKVENKYRGRNILQIMNLSE